MTSAPSMLEINHNQKRTTRFLYSWKWMKRAFLGKDFSKVLSYFYVCAHDVRPSTSKMGGRFSTKVERAKAAENLSVKWWMYSPNSKKMGNIRKYFPKRTSQLLFISKVAIRQFDVGRANVCLAREYGSCRTSATSILIPFKIRLML